MHQWTLFKALLAVCFLVLPYAASAQVAPQIAQLNAAQLWRRVEFRISNIPFAANAFNPDTIGLDATFTLPSRKVITVPAFWYQGYQRGLSADRESLTLTGAPEWRLRFTPTEAGDYSLSLTVQINGQPWGSPAATNFAVPVSQPATRSGYVRIAASQQYLETGDRQALRLIGANVCWPGQRGTFDYDDWFPAMAAAGENYARLWMWPSAFGIETDANSLGRYRQDHAWQLDYVLQLAEQRGIYLLLCLDYHGMFEVTPDSWGGNNLWPSNPYNAANGGPCLNQNAFFTNSAAMKVYQKRLRYLTARYGYSPNLLAWQFFNEIDNEYAYLNPSDVAQWHGVMGSWMHTNDPFGHLITTSLTGSSDRPEIWNLAQLDFAAYHSYGEPGPATRLASVAHSFLGRYRKPVLIDEFGIDWRGWNRINDPSLRGFRQALWGGALGGSMGTSMSWWWENIQRENVYPVYAALGTVLNRTGWGRGSWTNVSFKTAGAPPTTVAEVVPGQPFNVSLVLGSAWGGKPSGQLALPNATAAGYSASTLNSFVHGTSHSDLKTPFRLSAWLTNNARLVMHLNSVSSGAILVVRADGVELYRTNLANLDGAYSVNNEYNLDLPVNLPAGKRLIEVANAGADWFYLDWVRLEQVLPATYPGNWQPTPDAIALSGAREALLYVIAPGASFPAGATNASLPLQQGQTVTITNWPAGSYYVEWYDPATAKSAGYGQAVTTNSLLVLSLPEFREDLAGILYPPPALRVLEPKPAGAFQFGLDSEIGGQYIVQESDDLASWVPFLGVTNVSGTTILADPEPTARGRRFFRALQNH